MDCCKGSQADFLSKVQFNMANSGCALTSLGSAQSAGPSSGAWMTFGLCKLTQSAIGVQPRRSPERIRSTTTRLCRIELGHIFTGFRS